MKKSLALSALVAMSLTIPALAFAEGPSDNRDRENHAQQERGAGPNHSYHKGDRLPAAEHRKEDVVNDWQARNMREPPSGHHWVRSGDDFVLAAIATGVIADVVLTH
jgi:Ni/Co efflux regulator RcnB